MSVLRGLFLAGVFWGASAALLAAQESPKSRMSLVGDVFHERFEGSAKVPVSGDVVAGVQLGARAGKFEPTQISVATARRGGGRNICLSLGSRDGRYSSRNLFKGEDVAGLAGFTFKSNFSAQISQYDDELIAVLVREVDSCDSADPGVLLPRRFGSGSGDADIIVAVNAPAPRTTVMLLKEGQEVSRAPCVEDKSKVSMAFAGLCRLGRQGGFSEGDYVLEVRVRERFETVEMKYPLRLAAP